ncbi:globin family protein [Pseudoruegeria sp. HB172150]|uniref:globin family protein n=1 Tax=Pseudoruegeria sp. HB172150 TaxID=2721164 RepID=UPI001556A579|nr:globin family protein [Pseudoruegeria sp. HB172150]
MTPQDICLIRDSWARVEPIAETAVSSFYQRLFDIAPELREHFASTDMAAQHVRLAQTLGAAVANLDDPATLVPILRKLGETHAGYGADVGAYDKVGLALLWTLENGLGPDWTPDTREAWTRAYGFIVENMLIGAASAEAA